MEGQYTWVSQKVCNIFYYVNKDLYCKYSK